MDFHLRKTENLHILLWLIKDTCWVLDLKWPGMLMILPTLAVAIYITVASKSSYADFMHNLAICFWISANAIWMTGEFFFND